MDPEINSPPVARHRPPVLIVGAFLSESTGIRFVCEDLAAGLRSRGWSVITTSRFENRATRLGDMLATVWGKRGRYSVAQMDVYSGLAFAWAEAVAASLTALRCPYVLTLHSGAFPEFAERWPGRVRRLLRSAAAVTSPSPYLKERLAAYRPDIRVIRNGLHVAEYPVRDHVSARPRLVWIRHFEQRYNPVLALEVVSRLSPDFPEIELLMVGSDRQDWSAEQTLEEARRLGVVDRVRVLGAVPKADIPGILQQGDIFLNTTNVDNAPVTVVEAMACGLCVVSTDAGGVPYLVSDEHDALLVPRTDPEAMAAAVRRVLTDPALAVQLSRNARECAEAFSWEEVLTEWEDLLCAVQSRPRMGPHAQTGSKA
jgi:glycosyltransferase involved in cell wall biosynthesis